MIDTRLAVLHAESTAMKLQSDSKDYFNTLNLGESDQKDLIITVCIVTIAQYKVCYKIT